MSDDKPSADQLAAAMWPDMAKPGTLTRARVRSSPTSRVQATKSVEPSSVEPSKANASDQIAALWPDMAEKEQKSPRQRAVVARSKMAVRPEEVLYEQSAHQSEPKEDWLSAIADARVADEVTLAQGDDAEVSPEAVQAGEHEEVLEIAPGFDVIAPEGFSEYSAEALDVFAPIVDRTNMSKADAQELVNLHAKALVDTYESVHEHNVSAFDELQRAWATEASRDPELLRGGFKKNMSKAKEVLKRFGPDGLRDDLQIHGLTNNPRLIKFLARVHAAIYQAHRRRYGS